MLKRDDSELVKPTALDSRLRSELIDDIILPALAALFIHVEDGGRDAALAKIFNRPIWDEGDLAVLLDVEIGTIRHMKVRGELPAIVHLNKRCWRVHRDSFLDHFRQLPQRRKPGRPPKASTY